MKNILSGIPALCVVLLLLAGCAADPVGPSALPDDGNIFPKQYDLELTLYKSRNLVESAKTRMDSQPGAIPDEVRDSIFSVTLNSVGSLPQTIMLNGVLSSVNRATNYTQSNDVPMNLDGTPNAFIFSFADTSIARSVSTPVDDIIMTDPGFGAVADRSQDLTLSWTTSLSNDDFVDIEIRGEGVSSPQSSYRANGLADNGSVTIPASKLASFKPGRALVIVRRSLLVPITVLGKNYLVRGQSADGHQIELR